MQVFLLQSGNSQTYSRKIILMEFHSILSFIGLTPELEKWFFFSSNFNCSLFALSEKNVKSRQITFVFAFELIHTQSSFKLFFDSWLQLSGVLFQSKLQVLKFIYPFAEYGAMKWGILISSGPHKPERYGNWNSL